jgi:hypothetical protein
VLIYHVLLLLFPLALTGAISPVRRVALAGLLGVALAAVALSGLRWDSDADHIEYAWLYEDTPSIFDLSLDSISELYGEPGYLFVSSIFRSFGAEFYALSFLCAFFAITAKAFIAQRLVHASGLALCLYLGIHFVTIEFIQIRWAVASSLLGLAFLAQHRGKHLQLLVCWLLAFSFHYFSAIFAPILLLLYIKKERYLYLVLVLMMTALALIFSSAALNPELGDAEAYIIRRLLRYLSEDISTVGIVSYIKLLAYPIAYFAFTIGARQVADDGIVVFLRRLSFMLIVMTASLSFVPIMHHRTVVLADFFSILLLVRVIEQRFSALERASLFAAMTVPFGLWLVLDIAANAANQTLLEYKSWLPSLL